MTGLSEKLKENAMDKEQLLAHIKQYTEILKDINKMLCQFKEYATETWYMDLYCLGNDISQQLDILKYEFANS